MYMNILGQAIRIIDADTEGEWRTIKGSHVLIGEDGKIIKGNETLKSKLNNKAQENVKKSIANISVESVNQNKWPGALETYNTKLNTKKDKSHPTDWNFDDIDSRIKLMESRMNIDIEDKYDREDYFYDTFDALVDYTDRGYHEIIESQINGDDDYKAQLIENFIKGSPKYGGSIYRGIRLSKDEADKLQVGDIFDNRGGMSSWSTDNEIDFFDTSLNNDNEVVVQLSLFNGTKWGTSITPYSSQGDMEGEVLVSKNQKCKITNIAKKEGRYIVTVEEI